MEEQEPIRDGNSLIAETPQKSALASARTRLLVLAAFPWLHGQIITADSLTAVVGTDQLAMRMVEWLQSYETLVFTFEDDRFAGFQNLLQLQDITFVPDPTIQPGKNDYREVFLYVFQLSVLDRMFVPRSTSSHQEDATQPSLPTHVRVRKLKTSCKQFVSKLKDWVKLLHGAREALESVDWTQAPETADDSNVSPGLRILRSIAETTMLVDVRNIRFNLDMAALCLLRLLTETRSVGQIGDVKTGKMTDNAFQYSDGLAQSTQADGTVDINTSTHHQLSEDERERIRKSFKRLSTAQAQYPLQAAIFLTPLVLLSTTQVAQWSWNRLDMMRLSKNLGNNVPPILQKVESLIFDGLISIVVGQRTSLGVLKNIISAIQWDEINAVDDIVAKYYTTSTCDAPKDSIPLLVTNVSEPMSKHILLWDKLVAAAGGYHLCGKFIDMRPSVRKDSAGGSDDDEMRDKDERLETNKDGAVPDKADQDDIEKESDGPDDKAHDTNDALSDAPPKPSRQQTHNDVSRASQAQNLFQRPLDRSSLKQPVPAHNLNITEKPTRYQEPDDGKGVAITFGSTRSATRIKLIAHRNEDITLIRAFLKDSDLYFAGSFPMHLCDMKTRKKLLAINCIDKSQLPTDDVAYMILLQNQHLFISHPQTDVTFSVTSLASLRSFSSLTPIMDHSLPLDDPARVRNGTMADLYNCAIDKEAKILSAVGFPMTGSPWNDGQHSTDYVAWRATQRMLFAQEDIPLPTGDFAHGAAATAGAVHWWRCAPHGLGMTLKIKTGQLVLIIARPRNGWEQDVTCNQETYLDFAVAKLFSELSETKSNCRFWITEKVILGPSSEFVMRPCTPYFIYVAENSLWESHYFYCGRLMHDSLYGMMHHLLYSKLFSSDFRPNHFRLIHRIIQFHYLCFIDEEIDDEDPARAHLPNFSDMRNVADFLCLCTLGILSNVLDIRTYQIPEHVKRMPNYRENSDMNGVPEEDRYAYIYMRAQSFCLVDWLFHSYDFSLDDKILTKSFAHKNGFSDPLGALCTTLKYYSKDLQEYHPDIPYQEIHEQLKLCFQKDAVISEWLEGDKSVDYFIWDYVENWNISKVECAPFGKNEHDYLHWAQTAADDMYFAAEDLSDEETEMLEESEGVESHWDDSNDEDYKLPTSRQKRLPKKSQQLSRTPSVEPPKKKQKSGGNHSSSSTTCALQSG